MPPTECSKMYQGCVFLCLLAMAVMVAFTSCKECVHSLGMEDGRIKDSQITVSSAIKNKATGEQARLNQNIAPFGAWCPNISRGLKNVFNYDQYIQLDLLNLTNFTRIATQGRQQGGGTEFVGQYKVSYSRNGYTWIYYDGKNQVNDAKTFFGNSDTHSVVTKVIEPVIIARYIRIHPGYKKAHVCMRLEVYGCELDENGKVILSYSTPVGHVTANGKNQFKDTSYNGIVSSGYYKGGTGILTDGKFGPDDAKELDGEGWVGWDSTLTQSKYIAIRFEFSVMRKFKDVTLTVNTDNSRKYDTFNRSQIFFASTKDDFSDSSFLQYCPRSRNGLAGLKAISFNSNITLPLCENTAKLIKMELYFGGRWLLITEITFNSVPSNTDEKLSLQECSGDKVTSLSCPVAQLTSQVLPSMTEVLPTMTTPTQRRDISSSVTPARRGYEVKTKTSMVIILLGVGLTLSIMLNVLFGIVFYRRRPRAKPRLSTSVSVPINTVKPADNNQETDDVEARNPTAPYEEVHIYTELDKKKLNERETNYQPLFKPDSDYVKSADDNNGPYEDVEMVKNTPGYKELDNIKREQEDISPYQKLIKK